MFKLCLMAVCATASVVDGDTLRTDSTRYRLWGIDAPERGEALAREATSALRILLDGKTLFCFEQGKPDRYGRPIVQCFLGNPSLPSAFDPSEWLVASGLAHACVARYAPAQQRAERADVIRERLRPPPKPWCVKMRREK